MGVRDLDIESGGPVLGIFFGISTILTVMFLNRVQGKAYRIQDYLASREWHLIQSETVIVRINAILVFSCWVFFFLPVITLLFWGAGMVSRKEEYNQNAVGGVAVLLVGFSLIFGLLGVFKIKWNRYRISKLSIICLALSLILISAFQISTIFIADDDSFFGLSAIFLTANAIVMIIITFMNSGRTGTSIGEIVSQLPTGKELDIHRPSTYDDEITEAYDDDDYLPTQNELFEIFTLNKTTKRKKMLGPFEGGLVKLISGLSRFKRILSTIILYLFAFGILLSYAFLDYYTRDKSRLGDITMVAVIASDIILYLYAHSEIVTSPAEISLHLILFRLCLFVLGGNYWIYGYCLLYLYFGSYLAYHIAMLRFPFMDEIIEKELEDLDNTEESRNNFNIAKTPEFLLLLCTIVFVILLVIMEILKPDDIPLKDYEIERQNFRFWAYGVFSILGVVCIFVLVLVYRIFRRKRNGIEGKVYFYIHFKNVDLFWFFLIIMYGLCVIIALCLNWITNEDRYLIVGFLAPLAVIFLFNTYLKFALNDFRYLQDVNSINKVIDKHNDRIDRIKEEISKFRRSLASKTGTNVHKLQLSPEDIEELSRSKLEYQPKKSQTLIDPRDDEDDEEKLKSIEEEKNQNIDQEEEKIPEDAYDDEEIEEGGSEDEKEENIPNSARRSASQMDSKIPGNETHLFKKAETFNKGNAFGKAASMILKNDEISYDGNHTAHARASKKFKRIHDWRRDTNFLFAFFSGKLRPNDYHVYLSFMISVVVIMIMGLIVCLERWSVEGISWAMAFLYFFFTYGIMVRPISCDGELHKPETVVYVLTLVCFFAWGFIDFAIRFDFDPDEDNDGHFFLVWYILLIPFVGILTTGLYKWYDKNWVFGEFVKISLSGAVVQGIILLVCCYVFIGPVSGTVIAIIVAAIVYIVIVIYIYNRNGNYLPKKWLIANGIILSLIAITTFIVSLAVDGFSVFIGWSISYGIITGMIFLYGMSDLFRDLMSAEEEPVYFSPWVFPVFKYIPKKNDIQLRNTPAALVLLSLSLALGWSFQCTTWITPISVGVSVCCLAEVLFIIFVLYLVSFTPSMLEDIKMNLDQMLVKRAWLEAKKDYVQAKNIETPESMITFEEIVQKRDDIVKHLKCLRKDNNYAKDSRIDFSWNTKNINPTSIHECRKYLFEVEVDKTNLYIDELSLMIHFELLLILHVQNLVKKDRKFLFKFLEIKKHALAAANININIPAKGKPKYKQAKVLTQISRLSAEKQVLFRRLKDAFVDEERDKEEEILEQERIQEKKEKERQTRLADLTEKKRSLLENLDPTMSIDDMPDCEPKYTKVINQYKSTKKQFEDKQFPPNEASLGAGCLNRGVAKWMRASEIPGTVLYRESVDARDVVQGALGDCYFLSAMSVLGDNNVKKAIKTLNETDEDEAKAGAYWVRFYKYGEIEDVIIDDYFPVLGNGEFAFAKGGPDGKELWPMVLEKAYAKLNGSYNYIEAGKVQYALSDMTGGVSEQIELRTVSNNQKAFWERLKSLVEQKALMGAGSPEHAMGDRAINEFGIVQGHAYAVLGIAEFDEFKLINLRNPHGNRGVEWNGDWADDSDMWTQRAKNKCNYSDEVDGIFWMDLDDFIDNYSFLYVCRLLDNWHKEEIEDEWIGESAEGLPNSMNRNARLELNPQYEIRLSSPGPIFIQMTQLDKVNMFKGKHFIMYLLQNTNGGRFTRIDKNTLLGMSGKPTNLNVVSSEIQLTNKNSYPLVTTLLVANTQNGEEGEGKFEVSIYSLKSFTVTRI